MDPNGFLEKLRSQYLNSESDDLLFDNKTCTIAGIEYRLNCWKDFLGKDSVVIFQLKQNSILATDSLCIGIRYSEMDGVVLLEQQQLAGMGIH